MNKNFDIENFSKNGIAYPFEIENMYSSERFVSEYFKFNEKSQKIFGSKISLKPHLLSTFFDKMRCLGPLRSKWVPITKN